MNRDYKNEMKRLKEHRKLYFPAVTVLLKYYKSRNEYDNPIEFTDVKKMLILQELIDVGYLNPKVVVPKKPFNSLEKIVFNLDYPLTQKGDEYYFRELETIKQKIEKYKAMKKIVIFLLFICIIVFFIFYFSI